MKVELAVASQLGNRYRKLSVALLAVLFELFCLCSPSALSSTCLGTVCASIVNSVCSSAYIKSWPQKSIYKSIYNEGSRG